MWEKIKLIFTNAGAFIWPRMKKVLIAMTPAIEAAAKAAVSITAAKYKGQLNTRAEKLAAHEDAFGIILNNAGKFGIDLAKDGVDNAIDEAIKAAITNIKAVKTTTP